MNLHNRRGIAQETEVRGAVYGIAVWDVGTSVPLVQSERQFGGFRAAPCSAVGQPLYVAQLPKTVVQSPRPPDLEDQEI